MKIEKIKINSFRSFGIDNNIINLDKINTIIGVNESGKSNLVKAMSGLDLTGINDVNFFKEENNILHQKPTFEITLMPYDFEIEKYSLLQKNTTILTINDRFDISVSGEFSNYISKPTYDFTLSLNPLCPSPSGLSVHIFQVESVKSNK